MPSTAFPEKSNTKKVLPENDSVFTKQQLENIISDILLNDGPDGHCDGADIIADFVHALLNNTAKEWIVSYFKNKPAHYSKNNTKS